MPADSEAAAVVAAVDHVGIAVTDLDAAVAFYTEVLGLQLVHQEENTDQGVVEAMLAPPDDPSGAQLQLLAPLSKESPIGRFLDRSGPGLQQLACRVGDIERVTTVLRQKGVRLIYDSARPGTRGSRVNFVHPRDAGGVLIELVQPADEGPMPSAAGAGAAQPNDADEKRQA